MRVADRDATEQRLDRVIDVALLDTEEFEPILVDRQPQPRTLSRLQRVWTLVGSAVRQR
jgi:hypothetical protein